MAVAQVAFLAAVLLLFSSGFHCSSTPPACPESCTCQRAPLLNCSSSGLSLVPQHIQDSVTELDLSHNLLDFVTLHQPHHNLRNVWLGNNSITRLSLCIERAPGSQDVRGRRLHRLRPWSRGCVSWAPTLQLLSVERNQLVQFPEGLDGSDTLQVLQLSFNRISTLRPGVLSNLRQLKELHLQHNLIRSLHPQMFQDLAQLRVLDLSFNMLTSLHPLMYLSLRNIGADVSLGGNRWQCDCSMRSLRRRMAYDRSRIMQSWSIVCASPSILSGRDLLQLEEDDLNCFSTENRPELHQDVTVYSGSKILLTCSMQDSLWWMPNGQASVSQPQAGLLIRDITEGDTGLYVCMSEEHEVVSVFNLHISRIGGTRRKTRSLPRTSQQIITKDTSNRMGQEGNQIPESDFVLAVCLSVFITFLIAFILGVLARPLFDVFCRRFSNKNSSSETNSVSSVEQRQYDNAAYSNCEELDETRTYRERRVTFSTVDFREETNVQYYDTVAIGEQESINNDPVIKCEAAEKDKHTAEDSGSENSLRQNSPEDNQRDGRDHTHNMEVEHIPDRVELEERRSLSSHSDSSLSDKELKEDQMTQGHHTTPKSPQLAEDSVQQRADLSTDWLPQTNTTNLKNPELWQEDGELFEFSDSVRSTSARSSSIFGSFNHPKLITAPTSDKQRGGDMSSSSSYVSGDSDQEEDEDMVRNYTEPEVSFEQQIHNIDPIRPSVGFNHGDYGHDIKIKKHLDIKAPSPPADSSSSSDSEDETTNHIEKQGQDMHMERLPIKVSQTVSQDPETNRPTLNLEHTMRINRRLDIKASLPISDSSSSSDSEDERIRYTEKQRPGKVNIAGLPLQESQSESHHPETQWPMLDLEHTTRIKRRLDIKAPSPTSDSSSTSDSEDETTNHIKKQEQGDTYIARPPIKVSQTVSRDPETQWPTLDLEHIPRITRRLDIKAPSPPPDSSSTSEDKTTGYIEKQRPAKGNIASLPFQETQAESRDPETQWPMLDLEHTTRIKRRLDIKAPSPPSDSSSSSDSEDERIHYAETQRPGKVKIAGLPFQESQTKSHYPETQWPTLDLEHTTRIKRRLDIKATSPTSDSSSSSDSEDETTNHIKKQEQGDTYIARPPIKVSQTVSHDPETQWPTLDLEHIPRITRRLDIKAPSPPPDSSFTSEDKTTGYIEKQRPAKVNNAALPFQETQAESHVPETQWPTLDLEHTTHIKRRLDIKAPSPTSDSSSTSDSEDETTNHIKKQEQGDTYIARPPIKVSQTVSHDPETQWPTLDLEHIPRITRRLDIKAPSPSSDSSSSSDSEDETTGYIEKQRPGKVNIAGLPFQESQAESHDPETRWPTLDLEHITRIKRRLDIKAPLPTSDSSSTSDSEDETTNHMKKQEQGETYMVRPPFKVSQTVSHDPETQRPTLDLEHTTRIKRRLDIKAPSPSSHSSSSSDSEDETTGYLEKQRPGKVNISGLPFQESQTVSHHPETRWLARDLEHTTRIKRRLDIKATSPPSDSSSSSDSEDETTNHIKKQEQGDTYIARPPIKVSQTVSHDPETQWPTLDLEHIPRITRRLDIKAPSPPPDSSFTSEDKTTGYIEKQRPAKVNNAALPFQETQAESHVAETQWPTLDLEHTTHIKRRLDMKAPSPSSDSSSSSDSEDETTNHMKKQEQGETYMVRPPFKVSQTVSHDPETQWPTLDLEHTTHIKRRLDIKAPSPSFDSSSSSDSEDETTGYIEKQRPGKVNIAGLPFQESQAECHDPETRWPTLDLEHITRIKKRLDIKAPLPTSESSSTSDSEDETTNHTKKQEQGETYMVRPPFKVSQTVSHDPETQWPTLDLEHTTHIKRRLDIKAPAPTSDSSSSSDSEDETTGYIEKQRPGVGGFLGLPFQKSQTVSHDPGTQWPAVDLGRITCIKRRLDIRAPSPPSDSLSNGASQGSQQSESDSSTSDSEDEDRDHKAKHSMGAYAVSKATEKEFIRSPKTPVINISHRPKTDHNIKLEKYTVITDDLGDKTTSDNISTTPEINPELQSRWAMMNLGFSRFRKHLEITPHGYEPPNQPSSPPFDSPFSSSGESGIESKSSRTKQKRGGVAMQRIMPTESSLTSENKQVNVSLSLKGQDDNPDNSVEVEDRLRKAYSLPTTEEKSKPDTMLAGVDATHVKRYLDIKLSDKAPVTPPLQLSDSFSGSENEDESTEHAGEGWRESQNHTSLSVAQAVNIKLDHTLSQTDDAERKARTELKSQTTKVGKESDSWHHLSLTNVPHTKNTLNIRAPLQRESSSSSSEEETMDHSVPDLSLDVPRVKRRLNIKAPSPQPSNSPSSCSDNENEVIGYPAKQTYSKHTSNLSGKTDDDSLIEYKRSIIKSSSLPFDSFPSSGKAQTTDHTRQRHTGAEMVTAQEGSSHGMGDRNAPFLPRKVPNVSFEAAFKKRIKEFRHTTDVDLPPDIRWERKGLSALKALSSDRQKWDTEDNKLDMGTSPLRDDQDPQGDISSNHHRSEEYIKPLANQTSVNERSAENLLYDIPRYRSHVIEAINPPQELPPPVPATPPPDEAADLTWRSPQNSKKQEYESTRSNLQQKRSMEEPDPSLLTSENLAVYIDSSNEISEV